MMDEFQAEMFDVFAYETNDFLTRLEDILLQIEDVSDLAAEQVHEIFRIMHTIKSSSAMMGFSGISTLTHRMENLFQFIRDFRPPLINISEITDILFSCVDYMKQCLADKAEQEAPGPLLGTVAACLERMKQGMAKQQSVCVIRVAFEKDCDNASLRAFELISRIKKIAVPLTIEPEEGSEQEEEVLRSDGLKLRFPTGEALKEIRRMIEQQPFVAEVKSRQSDRIAPAERPEQPKEAIVPGEGILGVDSKKLELLINVSGETVISAQEVAHLHKSGQSEALGPAIERLNRLVLEIQERALSLRMVALNDTFQNLRRSLRDMAKDLGREIRFTISGEDLAMDKNMIQHLTGPLLHLLRNAVEHGIEPVAERIAAGKPEYGEVHLSAQLSGKSAVITLTDDGKGIDPAAVVKLAEKKNLITADQAAELSAEETYALLLAPGFSTKESVSEYSGRGVGLDVVNESLRRIGGRLQITSAPGTGSSFVLKIPLTLATMDSFLVRTGSSIYTIPVSSVQEVFRAKAIDIRRINEQDAVMYRDLCYAIWNLGEPPHSSNGYTAGIMMVMEHDSLPYVLFVDEIIDHRNIVVKPVPDLFSQVSGLLGCTVLGDGRVSLIIDDVIQLKSRRIIE